MGHSPVGFVCSECVCMCVRISLSTLALHRACGKSFLGQTYHSRKCGHRRLARYAMDISQTERQTHKHTHLKTHLHPHHIATDTCKLYKAHTNTQHDRVNGLIDLCRETNWMSSQRLDIGECGSVWKCVCGSFVPVMCVPLGSFQKKHVNEVNDNTQKS